MSVAEICLCAHSERSIPIAQSMHLGEKFLSAGVQEMISS